MNSQNIQSPWRVCRPFLGCPRIGVPRWRFYSSSGGGSSRPVSRLAAGPITRPVSAVLFHGVKFSSDASTPARRSRLFSSRPAADFGVSVLPARDDDHGGVIVEITDSMDPADFATSLRSSMTHWKYRGKKGVWIKLPIELSALVPHAVAAGFWYHHAEPSHLMLVNWLPVTAHTLPANATHRVGVGAFVFNPSTDELLAVQEGSGRLRGTGMWKIPTGVVEPGEDVQAGAVREVKEETGVDTEFVEVLAFRQSHGAFFGKSDLFFVCYLRPLSFEIQLQEAELAAARWMPIEEFSAQPIAERHELLRYIIKVGLTKAREGYAGFSPVRIGSAFSTKKSWFYFNSASLASSERHGHNPLTDDT